MGGQKKGKEVNLSWVLRMQSRESFPNNKRMIVMPHLPSFYHHFSYKNNNNNNNNNTNTHVVANNDYSYYICSPYCETIMMSSSDNNNTSSVSACVGDTVDDGVGVCGGSFCYNNISSNNNNNNNKVECWSDLYDVVGASTSVVSGRDALSSDSVSLTRMNTFDSPHKSSGGGFTVRQWEELERQIMICKYMMASIPVPPHLLLTLSNSFSTISQSNQSTTMSSCRLDARFTRGGGSNNDAEPWRCRRTDGKKWRCSRDVVPYQKYCERHAHKPRPRSRKPVEPQQTTTCTNPSISCINNSTSSSALQTRQVFNIPAIISGPNYAQPRCTEWFMKGDPIPGSSLNEQWQQHFGQPSPREGLKLYDDHDKDVSVFQKHYGKEHELDVHTNTYLCSNDDSSFHNRLASDHQAQTTRHFIDAWSCADRELEVGHISNQTPSLTLSMSGGATETEWLDSNPYTCSPPPGGPLGEALCLGISSTTTKGQSNLASPHGGYSNSTTTSTCSKSSCDDNAHGLHFR